MMPRNTNEPTSVPCCSSCDRWTTAAASAISAFEAPRRWSKWFFPISVFAAACFRPADPLCTSAI
jgi:hypothetical protein